MPGRLYVVSTPIGNLDDTTFRAVDVLKSVGLIAAEDTRRTAILLRHFGISTSTTSLHEHNERQKLASVLATLNRGIDVALVSDAGTPLVADPGQRLVSAAIAAGIEVVPVPGPSAALAALTVSGFPADEFVFQGFAPSRSSDRAAWVDSLHREHRVVVFYEAPHRIRATLSYFADKLGNRPIVVARELTKMHEQVTRAAADSFKHIDLPERGEFTIVIGPLTKTKRQMPAADAVDANEVVHYFGRTTDNRRVSRRAAVNETAKHFGLSTNDVYALLERLKNDSTS
jgi:16S rRNA (cytidine1402-2'-O)-methyltransferase